MGAGKNFRRGLANAFGLLKSPGTALSLARIFPRKRFRKIPKTVSEISRGEIVPFWARDRQGRRFGTLLLSKSVPENEMALALSKFPSLSGKKVMGVSYLAVKSPLEERGKLHSRSLFGDAKQWLSSNGYSALVITANDRMTRVYSRYGFVSAGQIKLPDGRTTTCSVLLIK